MKAFIRFALLPLLGAGFAHLVPAAELAAPQPLPSTDGNFTIYRQFTSDGRVLYSDKTTRGAIIDHIITIEPPIKGNLWTTEAGPIPRIPPQTERTAIRKVPSIPVPGRQRSIEDANTDVIKAEMLLEDARKRRQAEIERMPASDKARREPLDKEVADAEVMLNQAIAVRNAMRNARYGAF